MKRNFPMPQEFATVNCLERFSNLWGSNPSWFQWAFDRKQCTLRSAFLMAFIHWPKMATPTRCIGFSFFLNLSCKPSLKLLSHLPNCRFLNPPNRGSWLRHSRHYSEGNGWFLSFPSLGGPSESSRGPPSSPHAPWLWTFGLRAVFASAN